MIKISNGGVLLSDSNMLRFVRTDNTGSTKPTIFNRLTENYDYKNVRDNWSFWQQVDIGDNILTQIATIYTLNSFKLYNWEDDSLVDTITIPAATYTFNDATYGTINYYDLNIDTTLLGGYYYVIATINTTQTYESEPFYIDTYDYKNGIEIKWYNDTDSNWDDGIYYDGSQEFLFKLDSRFFDIEPGSNKSVYENWNGNEQTLTGEPTLSVLLETSAMPLWLEEKINLILQHDNVFINDLEVTASEDIGKEWIKQGEMGSYRFVNRIRLSINNYQLNDTFEAAAEEETNYILTGDGKRLKVRPGGGKLKYKTS